MVASTELARLLDLQVAFDSAGTGDDLVAEGRHAEAGVAYEQALALAPDSDELLPRLSPEIAPGAADVRAALSGP